MANEKPEIIAMKEYLKMLMECTIPISFYGEIFEGQEAKVLLKVLLRKLEILELEYEVIKEVLQTLPVLGQDISFAESKILEQIGETYQDILKWSEKTKMVETLPFEKIEIDEYYMTPSAPTLEPQRIPESLPQKFVELQRDTNTNSFGINAHLPWGFRKKKFKVTNVEEDSNADKKNVKKGDKLKIQINGKDISKYSKRKILRLWEKADKIVLKY